MNKATWELLPFWFPKSQSNRNWAFVFALLTILSIDWWNWKSSNRLGDWIPIWIIYLIVIQLALAYSVWKFSKVFNPVIIKREFNFNNDKTVEMAESDDKGHEEEANSDKKNITNIYMSDSVINRIIIGGKDEEDE